MTKQYIISFSSLEEAWFLNEAIISASSKEEAYHLLKECIDKGDNPFAEFDATQGDVVDNVFSQYEIEDLKEASIEEYFSLPTIDGLAPLEKAESSKIAQILEIEIGAIDNDVFSLLKLVSSDKIILIKDFINFNAENLYEESVASKWNQFKSFVQQSGVKYITLVKNGEQL